MPVKELKLDLVHEGKEAELEPKRRILNKLLEGNFVTLFKGRGIEFTGFRKYEYGDDASMIDWSASLRAKSLLIREFEEYKNFDVFFLLNTSDTMLFSSTGKLKAEYAAELVSELSNGILKTSSAAGIGMYTDKLVNRLPPEIGKDVHNRIVKALGSKEHYGGKIDFTKSLKLALSYLRRRTMIIIVSDFLSMSPGWEKYIQMASQKHDVIGIMVNDPRDFEMPFEGGQYLLQDPGTGETLYVDSEQYRAAYEMQAAEHIKKVKKVFEKSQAGFIFVRTDKDFYSPLIEYTCKRTRSL